MQARQEIVSEQIRQIISAALLHQLRDPRLSDVTVTRVKVSPDLGYADVRFMIYQDDRDPQETLKGFHRAKGALKRIIAKELTLRRIPELRFHLDEDAEAELRIGEILDQMHGDDGDGT